MHALIASPYMDRFLLVRPGFRNGVKIPQRNYDQLASAEASGQEPPPRVFVKGLRTEHAGVVRQRREAMINPCVLPVAPRLTGPADPVEATIRVLMRAAHNAREQGPVKPTDPPTFPDSRHDLEKAVACRLRTAAKHGTGLMNALTQLAHGHRWLPATI